MQGPNSFLPACEKGRLSHGRRFHFFVFLFRGTHSSTLGSTYATYAPRLPFALVLTFPGNTSGNARNREFLTRSSEDLRREFEICGEFLHGVREAALQPLRWNPYDRVRSRRDPFRAAPLCS